MLKVYWESEWALNYAANGINGIGDSVVIGILILHYYYTVV